MTLLKRFNSTSSRMCMAALAVGAVCAIRQYRNICRYSFTGRTVVITGGSRGLGLVMAKAFATEGARLVLLARDLEELRRAEAEIKAAGGNVLTIPCDVTDREQIEQAVHRVVAYYGRIDVLINNAGIIQVGPFEHMTIDDFEQAMALHFFAPLLTTLAVLPFMKGIGGGRIVNIASIGGKVAMPHLLPYTASKFALVGLSDGFRAELSRHNIRVTTVCPGLMRTGSLIHAKFKGKHRSEYTWMAVAGSWPVFSIQPERAARQIVEACRRGKPSLQITVQARTLILIDALFPNASARLMAMANRLLPKPMPVPLTEAHSGADSENPLSRFLAASLRRDSKKHNEEQPETA